MLDKCFVVLCCQFPGIDDTKIRHITNMCNSLSKIFSIIFQKHLHMVYKVVFEYKKTATSEVNIVLLQ